MLSSLCCPSALVAQSKQDLPGLQTRWGRWTLSTQNMEKLTASAHRAEASEGPDGCWAAIPYDDQTVSEWRTAEHLKNLNDLATASFVLRHRGTPDHVLDDASLRALRCWLHRDPKNPNWWWNEIGAPQSIAQSALLLRNQLSEADRNTIDRILRRSNWSAWTGQNLAWGVNIQILRGLLEEDPVAVKQAFDRLYEEVRVAPVKEANGRPGEGIQADSSFHQHGAQLYSGGYGYGFGVDVGRDIALGWGTTFQIPKEPMRIYSSFMLDGQRWMIRAGTFDYIARGREITRVDASAGGKMTGQLAQVVSALAELDSPRQKEFRQFAASLRQGTGAGEVSGNRYFWNSDLMEQKRKGYSTSVRMFSSRTQNEEVINGEGLRSVHLADGANLLYKNGDEYRGIFPVWDWNLIPGTTALQWTSSEGVPLTGEQKSIGQRGTSDFVGGVSDGTYGATAMELKRGPLSAKKAWFFFDHLYVALGTDVTVQEDPSIREIRVTTAIEQNNKHGEVVREQTPSGKSIIVHNGTGYVLEPGEHVMLTYGIQSGHWSDIGTGSADPVALPVFRLSIDHGIQPRNASYQYTVLPNADLNAVRREAKEPAIQVLANTSNLQAVYSHTEHILMAVFYRAGTLDTVFGRLSIDEPCMLMLRDGKDEIKVSASNPRATAETLTVKLGEKTAVIHLLGGELGGKSETDAIGK